MIKQARRNGRPWKKTTPAEQFRKVFPKPTLPPGEEDKFADFYEQYSEWVKGLEEDDDEDGDADMLEDSNAGS
jgi:hypothetical protein